MRTQGVLALAGSVLLGAYALVLFHHTSFAAGGSDSSGYLNAARLLASGHATEPIRGLARLGLSPDFAPVFVPLGYTPLERRGRMAPSYPPGLPLHMAIAARIGGWAKAPFLVSPLAGIACLILLYRLGRELRLPPSLAAAGCALFAFFPTFVFQELQPMSDVLATAWALAAVLAAYRSRSRESVAWAAFAGLAFGIGVLVRPTNAVLLVALVIAIPARPTSWLAFIAGGIPAALFLLGYDAALFGSPLATGYRTTLSEGMAWENFPDRARHYGIWLARLLTPLVPIGWIAFAADRRAPRRDRAVLVSWFGAFFLFYCFYAPYETWWYTRFLLPGVPALILAALLFAHDFAPRAANGQPRPWAFAGAAVLLALGVVMEIRFIDRNGVHKFYKGDRQYVQGSELARRRLPPEAIVASMQMSGALHFYTDATYAMWNWLLPDRFAALRASTESRGHRWYALLAPFEQEEVRRNLPGDWREIDRVGDVALWELPPAAGR
ncbi:MAG TPA: glycosyltransferase family 39 protein [Thermoanaerobaculia bacterium]|nr:glycosyltransferase family 39 protein [Thermoanaerobaculia bacterium]